MRVLWIAEVSVKRALLERGGSTQRHSHTSSLLLRRRNFEAEGFGWEAHFGPA